VRCDQGVAVHAPTQVMASSPQDAAATGKQV
jgi:hypothetical protein